MHESNVENNIDLDFELFMSGELHLNAQSNLNDLIRDFSLTEIKAEVLGSRLQ